MQCAQDTSNADPIWPTFGAALLAGGSSKRMGSDKALLHIDSPDGPITLWSKQWKILQSLAPAELFFSGPARPGLPKDAILLIDLWVSSGPLAGIATCLRFTKTDFLLVLAVDLPNMNANCLLEMLRLCHQSKAGVVPVLNTRFEPLVAIYPKASLEYAVERVVRKQLRLQAFIGELMRRHLVVSWEVPPIQADCFINWNEPWQTSEHPT